MRSTLVLAWKEMRQIFLSPIAYAFLVVFVFFVNFMFFKDFFRANQASMSNFFGPLLAIAFAVVIPGVTMRMWAEERKQGTIEFLLTAPVHTWHIVLGKFLAGLSLVTLCLLLTLSVPYTISRFGDLDSGPVWGGYLGSLLLGGACLAVGMFFSSFTQDQIVGFLVSCIVLFALVLVGMPYIQQEFGGATAVGGFLRHVSPTPHYESIGRGVVDLRDVVYFASVIGFFLYLNVRVVDLRRWM